MKKIFSVLILGIFLIFSPQRALASHLKVDNVLMSEVNKETKLAKIKFNVSWDNAWKNDVNSDGIWVFAKFKTPEGQWKHINLKDASNADFDHLDHTPAMFSSGDNVDVGMLVPEEKTGAFLFRTKGKGATVSKDVQLTWDYAKDGVSQEQILNTSVKVFGLEMVYVPQDKHYIGDPKGPEGPDNAFYTFPNNGAYLIASEDPILVDAVEGSLYCDQDNPRSREDTPFTIPAEFPKGYKAFWIMKYELTSQQFADFLNTLSRKQQQNMVEADISSDAIKNYFVKTNSEEEQLRNSIVTAKEGNGATEPVKFYTYAPARAVNFMSWSNIEAIADWAGLRPITELEYEKAARGSREAIVDDYPWGTADLGRPTTFDGADGSGYEKKVPQKGIVNCSYGGGIAPFDVAAGKTIPDNPGYEGPVTGELFENSRHEGIAQMINDGSSPYGVFNLSGNLWERCVTVGHQNGRAFDAKHGNGEIDADGFADVLNWPGKDGVGGGNRGGVWSSPSGKYLRIALRFAANFPRSKDGKNSGCRLGF